VSDGTFRPSGATSWSSFNTPRIWAMVANEDDPESWRQVAALGSMAGLLKDQRQRLELARDTLVQAWPPERNKAAAAFVDLIDDLLFNMAENKRVADANAGALSRVLEALRQAKTEIEPLYQAYLKKSDDWVPAWWDGAEDELDEKAREQMRGVDSIVARPESAIVAPDIYEFKPRTLVDDPIGGSGGPGSGSGVTPFAAGGAGGGKADISVPHDPPPPLPNSVSTAGQGPPLASTLTPGSSGPSLAGVITPPPIGPPPIAAVPIAPPSAPGPAFVPSTPGLVIGGPGGGIGQPAPGGGRRGLPESIAGRPLGRGSGPATKPATPSWLPPASGQAPARGAAGQVRRGGPASNSLMPASQPPGTRRRGEGSGDHPKLDPDNRWVTDQGVAPVIEPSRVRHRHDPGPGVIGWQQ
jgi:hypothetical protein